jgi:uncharacterized phage-associated protein
MGDIKKIVKSCLGDENEFRFFIDKYSKLTNDKKLKSLIKDFDKYYFELNKPVTDNPLIIVKLMLSFLDYRDDLLSHKKIHCLLYLFQGFFLAEFGKALFDEDLEHWVTMPCLPSVFQYFKDKGYNAADIIQSPTWHFHCDEENSFNIKEDIDLDLITNNGITLLKNVFNIYNKYTASGLMNIIEEQSPWYSTTYDEPEKRIITKNKLRRYFKTQLD